MLNIFRRVLFSIFHRRKLYFSRNTPKTLNSFNIRCLIRIMCFVSSFNYYLSCRANNNNTL